MLTRPDPTRQNPAKSWTDPTRPDPTRPDPTRGSIRPVDNSGTTSSSETISLTCRTCTKLSTETLVQDSPLWIIKYSQVACMEFHTCGFKMVRPPPWFQRKPLGRNNDGLWNVDIWINNSNNQFNEFTFYIKYCFILNICLDLYHLCMVPFSFCTACFKLFIHVTGAFRE